MPVKRLTRYPMPADRDAFHHRYESELWSLASELPGCTKTRVTVPLGPGDRPYHVIGELYFADAGALHAALDSETGRRYVALENDISTGGAPAHDVCVEHEWPTDPPHEPHEPHA